jgi:hypothetical protein
MAGDGVPFDVWQRTNACRNVSHSGSRSFCARAELRSRLAQAKHRRQLDAKLAKATEQLPTMPTTSVADPGATAAQ